MTHIELLKLQYEHTNLKGLNIELKLESNDLKQYTRIKSNINMTVWDLTFIDRHIKENKNKIEILVDLIKNYKKNNYVVNNLFIKM